MPNPKIVHSVGNFRVIQDPSGTFVVEKIDGVKAFNVKKDAIRFAEELVNPPTPVAESNDVLGWHFLDRSLLLIHGDGRKVEPGQTIHVDGPIVPMKNGLLVSTRAIVALKYGRRPIVCRVKGTGEVVSGSDGQFAVSDRTCIWMAEATQTVVNWAGWCVLHAIQERQDKGLPIDERTLAGANLALNYGLGDSSDSMNISSAASMACFSLGMDGWKDQTALYAAQAGSQAAQSAQAAINTSKSSFGGFNMEMPKFPGSESFAQFPNMANSIGSMDFAMTSAESAAEIASRVFSNPMDEKEIQNGELERRLSLLEPKGK